MLLLVDLDNTLVDRAAAFNSWSSDFVRLLGRPDSEAAWLIGADRDGYEPRDCLARAIKQRFRLDTAVEDLVHRLLYEHVDPMTLGGGVTEALTNAKEHGWKIAIVTNGTTTQQMLKIRQVGLEPYVDAVVISETERSRSQIRRFSTLQPGDWGQNLPEGGW